MESNYTESLIKKFKDDYKLDGTDFWLHKQSKNWIIKHNALEKVASQEKITWKLEVLNFSPDIVVKCIATSGDRVIESLGEASPKNTIINHPYAMAEKRAVDRAILKLVGLHGFVYSEDEFDTTDQKIGSADDDAIKTFLTNIEGSKTIKQATGYYEMAKVNIAKAKKSNPGLYQMAVAKYESKRKELQSV